MEHSLNLNLQQKQKLNMTPQLRMAIKLLQYSTMEVKNYIDEVLKENPLLEMIEKEGNVNYQDYPSNNRIDLDNILSKEKDLSEYLESQLFEILSKNEQEIGRFIIGNLDEHGFLKINNETIAKTFKISTEEVKKILNKIIELDPPGIATKNFQEALLVQLKMMQTDTTNEQIIVENYINELAEGNLDLIKDNLNISDLEIEQALQLIKQLNPYPASGFYQGQDTKYIIPDLLIKNIDGSFFLEDNSILPELKINNYYYKLLKKSRNSEEISYIKEKYKSANWLINSIVQRQRTILNIANVIIKKQDDFLNKGIKFLYTMTLDEVAKIVEVHESTVSRAINGKYIQTPHGLYELKFFFNSGVERFSSRSIKSYIIEFIKKEDSMSPLSDNKIASLISRKLEIKISRRTVAKYRNQMGLPSSNIRRRHIGGF